MTEQETVGDWAGEVQAEMERNSRIDIKWGTRALVTLSGENSRDHGFHDDWPVEPYPTSTLTGKPVEGFEQEVAAHQLQVRRAIAEKLALIHEEISEALGEIRSGRDPLEIYYVDHKGLLEDPGMEYEVQHYDANGTPLLKPEGFLVELADANIRIADLVYLVKGLEEFVRSLDVKHEYNATRPYKHGRKF